MRKIINIAILFVASLLVGCGNEPIPQPDDEVLIQTGDATQITSESVVLHGVAIINELQYESVDYGVLISILEDDLVNHQGEMFLTQSASENNFEVQIEGLTASTGYYYCALLRLNGTQYTYGEIKYFETLPQSITPDIPASNFVEKAFSVSNSKQVCFSKGNLQYHPKEMKWRFAENQLEYLGYNNENISTQYDGWLDLFGWGTGANPTNCSGDDSDYQSYVDWGKNKIENDSFTHWRTLTKDEWFYIFWNRPNYAYLKGIAQINGINGLILLPDDWECPDGVNFKHGYYSEYTENYSDYQSFNIEQWSILESAGAVFLPAAGCRIELVICDLQVYGYYWSSSQALSDMNAQAIFFYSRELEDLRLHHFYKNRYCGCSVRLVKDLQ